MNQLSSQEFKTMNVLVVDDDPAFVDLLSILLDSIGVRKISVARNGAEAYGHLNDKTTEIVDCVLCDYVMENGNGLQLLQAIRLGQIRSIRPDACFILVSANARPGVVAAASQLDVNAYLVKPTTPDILKKSITLARRKTPRLDFQKYRQVSLASC